MRNPNEKVLKEKNKVKIYRLFYVDPLSTFNTLWNIVIIFSIYLFEIQISLTLAFGPDFWNGQLHNKFYTVLYLVLLLIFCIDIGLNFNKGYYAFGRGKVIDDPWLIIKHYIRIHFFLDVLSTLLHNLSVGYPNYTSDI